MNELRIGISGWTYEPWRSNFYPKGLVQKRELEYASRKLNSIEINGSFYSLQTPESYRKWAEATPEDFVFAVKGPKYISHQKRLKEVRVPLANFFASGPLLLGEKFGPLLWQFPPWEKFEAGRFEDFLALLPRSHSAAAKLAAENTIKSEDNIWTEAVAEAPLRYAFEARNESFFTNEFVELLRKYDAALTFADSAGKWGYAEDVTSDFVYIRLHGKDKLYESDYAEAELDRWAKRINVWHRGSEPRDAITIDPARKSSKKKRDVFVYFDNSIKVHAPFDAMSLAAKLGIKIKGPAD